MRPDFQEVGAGVMGRTNGDSFFRKCPDCGSRQRVNVDTDGRGEILEQPEPCRICGARNGMPPRQVLRGDTLVEAAARMMIRLPDATYGDVYDALLDAGYEISVNRASFASSPLYGRAAKDRAEELRARTPGKTYTVDGVTIQAVRTDRERHVLVVQGAGATKTVRAILEELGADAA